MDICYFLTSQQSYDECVLVANYLILLTTTMLIINFFFELLNDRINKVGLSLKNMCPCFIHLV